MPVCGVNLVTTHCIPSHPIPSHPVHCRQARLLVPAVPSLLALPTPSNSLPSPPPNTQNLLTVLSFFQTSFSTSAPLCTLALATTCSHLRLLDRRASIDLTPTSTVALFCRSQHQTAASSTNTNVPSTSQASPNFIFAYMSKMAQVNGDLPAVNSATAQHLLDIPVIHDGVVAFRNNSLGKKSIAIGDSAYQTFAAPLLPYLARPWGYLRPYAEKADALGDQTLTKVEERVPVIKKPTEELYAGAKGIIALPIRTGFEAKDHVFKTYAQEMKKVGGENLVTYGKAIVSTTLITTSEIIIWVGDVMHYKKEEAKDVVNEKVNN